MHNYMMEKSISKFLLMGDGNYEVEFELADSSTPTEEGNAWLDYDIEKLNTKIAKLDKGIDIYTNDADKLDNTIAVASGLLCGLIDSFFVGTFSFEEGMNITNEKMEQKIKDVAKKYGWKGVQKGERKGQTTLDSAISFLEKKFELNKKTNTREHIMPSDPLENFFGGAKQHHFRDFSHHHSIIGLFFSILTQFTGRAYGTDTNGVFVSIAVSKDMIGTDLKRKWAIAVTDWALHLVSDMHGSSATAGLGAGIPGPIVSLLKAISALPIWGTKPHIPGEAPNPNSLSLFTAKLYNGTLLAQRDENGKLIPVKIDLRGEKAIGQQLGKQAIPVIINDVLVRVFYFIRRLYLALKKNEIHSWNDITNLNWRKIVPVNNRTINHMMLVASGTFVAVDLGDATIRSAIQCGGNWAKFATGLLLRINYPGIGRFVIALGTEGYMEFRRDKMRTERMALMTELLQANNIKVFYAQKQMWVAAAQAEEAINEMFETAEKCVPLIVQILMDNENDYQKISGLKPEIEKHNPWFLERIKNIK